MKCIYSNNFVHICTGSNGSDDEPAPPKPARPQFPSMSPTGSTPNLSVNASISSLPQHWNSTANLPVGHSTPAAGPSPDTGLVKPGARPHDSRSPPVNAFQGYFPSSSGYQQVNISVLCSRSQNTQSLIDSFIGYSFIHSSV